MRNTGVSKTSPLLLLGNNKTRFCVDFSYSLVNKARKVEVLGDSCAMESEFQFS